MEDSKIIIYIVGVLVAVLWTFGKNKLKDAHQSADAEERHVRNAVQEDKPVSGTAVRVSSDNTETSLKAERIIRHDDDVPVDPAVTDIKENFDIKKAILYKEILEPKYKQY